MTNVHDDASIDTHPVSRWYVMLFPSVDETAGIAAALQRLAAIVGGTANPTPHVTVGYFNGISAPSDVIDCVRSLTEPPVRMHASGLFSWSEHPHPLFGYTLSLHVRRTRAVQAWQCAARTALLPTGLTPVHAWAKQRPHMQVVREMPVPWQEALQDLPDRRHALMWTAARLVVSQQIGSQFVTWLDVPLRYGD